MLALQYYRLLILPHTHTHTQGMINDYWNSSQLIWQLVESVSCNGNLLLNVGPTADGRIIPAFQERLLDMGAWLNVSHTNTVLYSDLKNEEKAFQLAPV